MNHSPIAHRRTERGTGSPRNRKPKRHDDGVFHRAGLFEHRDDAGDVRLLLADRDVDVRHRAEALSPEARPALLMRAWEIIVSTPMVVLPVERSPMINSRWPRPIGIIASIAMMPVCTGWLTDLRFMMPGAIFSTG
jgi:hypothetical protein